MEVRKKKIHRSLNSISLPLLASLFAGCLQTEPAGSNPDDMAEPAILEPVRLSGATSSTNWPTDNVGRLVTTVMGGADTAIHVEFFEGNTSTGYKPIEVRGMATLFDGAAIPSLRPVDSVDFVFPATDTLLIPSELLDSLPHHGRDTITVNLHISCDTLQSLVAGFVYSRSERRFLKTPFSIHPPSSFYLAKSSFGFSANLDTSGVSSVFPPAPGSEWSFYIPGTSYYWRPESTTPILLDRIPRGIFPIRLVHLQPIGSDSTRVEVHEVELTPFIPGQNGQPHKPPTFRIGEKILSDAVSGQLRIRPGGF